MAGAAARSRLAEPRRSWRGSCSSPARWSVAGARRRGQAITLYNGQHQQTTDALVAGFEKADRHHGERAQRRRGHVRRRDRHRGVQLAGRRHLHRELAGPGVSAEQGPARHGRPATLASTPSRYNSPQGDWVGVSARVSVLIYNPEPDQPRASCRIRSWSWPTPSTRASSPSPRARPTSSRSSPPSRAPTAKRPR